MRIQVIKHITITTTHPFNDAYYGQATLADALTEERNATKTEILESAIQDLQFVGDDHIVVSVDVVPVAENPDEMKYLIEERLLTPTPQRSGRAED